MSREYKQERYGFVWYSDKEIFDASDEELDALAKKYHDMGYTVLITFSGTHFRWSFHRWWDDINTFLTRFCAVCHRYGIKVVEHHSCHLSYAANNAEEIQNVRKWINMRGLDPDKWPGIDEIVTSDPVIDGVPLSSMHCVDGATDKPSRVERYMAYGKCFNNPDFRRIYFRYLESLYKTGLDGIMTDDVQYINSGTCTCRHCRKLFREKTGYELPDTEHWSEFLGNYDDPVYVAWRRFRQESTDRFQRDVNAHFASLGLKLLRPNYVCGYLTANPTAYTYDNNRDLWTLIFQENFINNVIHQCWLDNAREAIHRVSLAERTGVDAMSLFYPASADTMYLCWALTHLWGQMMLTTLLGKQDMIELEKTYRIFDTKYPSLFASPKKVEDAAFWFSASTRDYTKEAAPRYMYPLAHLMESAIVSGYNCGFVFEWDTAEELKKHPVIILASVGMISDEEMARLKEYAADGGKLIVTGSFALFHADGSSRAPEQIESFLQETNAVYRPDYRSTLRQSTVTSERKYTKNPLPVPAPAYTVDKLRAGGGAFLGEYITKHTVISDPEILPGLYRTADGGMTLNLLNMRGVIRPEGEMVSHFDRIENFSADSAKLEAFTAALDVEGITSAELFTPEREDSVQLEITKENGRTLLHIPAGIFVGYAAIALK